LVVSSPSFTRKWDKIHVSIFRASTSDLNPSRRWRQAFGKYRKRNERYASQKNSRVFRPGRLQTLRLSLRDAYAPLARSETLSGRQPGTVRSTGLESRDSGFALRAPRNDAC